MFDFKYVEIEAWQVVVALLVIVAIIALPLIIISIVNAKVRGEKFSMSTRDIAYGAVCLALSYALSFFGFKMPMGGTITPASILPVAIYCYYFGYRKGTIVTTVYMLLQLVQTPYIVNVWSMLLDYLLPYFALSFVGLISYSSRINKKSADGTKRFALVRHWGFFVGMLAYTVVRYISHCVSGAVFWDASAEYGMSTIAYTMAYNSFCLIDSLIAAVGGLLILTSKEFNRVLSTAAARSRSVVQGTDTAVSAQVDRLDNTNTATEND